MRTRRWNWSTTTRPRTRTAASSTHVALGGVHLGRLEVERDVVLQRIGEPAALQELQRLEEQAAARAAGAEHQIAGRGPVAGREPVDAVADDGPEHRQQRELEPAVRLEPDGAPASRVVQQPVGQVRRAGHTRPDR